jgi:hypothetical protein
MRTPAALALLLLGCHAPGPTARATTPDPSRIDDGKSWNVINGETSRSVEDGKKVVRLHPKGGNRPGSNVALALVGGGRFDEGTIDVDLEGNGEEQASFVGVAFAVADDETYEAVYFRPFRFRAADPVQRAHGVQYVAWPQHTWEALRARAPGVYEAVADPTPDPARWFHARVEVTRKTVRVFVDGASRPCLVVDRLGGRSDGKLGLWVDSQTGAFANLKIAPR